MHRLTRRAFSIGTGCLLLGGARRASAADGPKMLVVGDSMIAGGFGVFLERALKPDERKPVTAVARAAVIEENGGASVLLVKDEMAKLVRIEIGAKLGDMIEVRGVQPGDRVVVKPLDAQLDGRKVKVETRQ